MKALCFGFALAFSALCACEFNRDGRSCEPRIPVGGTCAFGLSPADEEAPAGVRIAPGPGDPFPTGPVDQGCSNGSACLAVTLTCQTLPGPGEPCVEGSLCASPAICDFSTSRCTAAGLDGDPCPFAVCAAGHRCIENTCIASQLFSPCSAHAECPADHFCELAGTRSCLAKLELGASCASSAACLSPNVCSVEGVCAPPLEAGDECTDACGPGLFCTFRRSGTSDDSDVPIAIPGTRPGLGGTLSEG